MKQLLFATRTKLNIPNWLIGVALIGVLLLISHGIRDHRENFEVFLFDYEFGLMRRGLPGALVNLIPFNIEKYFIYNAFYGTVSIFLYFFILVLFWKALRLKHDQDMSSKILFCLVILMSPLFFKNLMLDFGRVDLLGFMGLFLFAAASTRVQRILIILLPPVLILSHEAQIIFTVAPMMAIFMIGALHDQALFKIRNLGPLVLSLALSLGVTLYFLLHPVPDVDRHVLNTYLANQSPYTVNGRSWLLYENFEANMRAALDSKNLARQLNASPLYVLALILHWPVIVVLKRIYERVDSRNLRFSCVLICLCVAAQCFVYILGIDFSRWMANIFTSFVAMLLYLIHRYDLDDVLVDHVSRHRNLFIALVFILLPIPKFGIVVP